MKKRISLFHLLREALAKWGCLIAVLSIFLIVSPVFAQKEIDDYLYQYEKYREVYTKFQSARDKYLQYHSLSSKKEAEQETFQALVQRAKTLRTYFVALKYKLKTTPGVLGTKYKAELSSRLDKEVFWVNDHEKDIEALSNPTLDGLFEISDRLEDKELDLKILSYKTLAAVLLGRERDLQAQSVSITDLLSDKIEKVEVATQAAVLKQWLEEVKNKNYLSQKQIEAAEEGLSKLDKENSARQLVKDFNLIQGNLESSKYFLDKALGFQKEIFKELTNYE